MADLTNREMEQAAKLLVAAYEGHTPVPGMVRALAAASVERDELQARIDAALALLGNHNGHFGLMFRDDLRATLQHGALCDACGRPRTPHHDASAPGSTMRHPYRAPLQGDQPEVHGA